MKLSWFQRNKYGQRRKFDRNPKNDYNDGLSQGLRTGYVRGTWAGMAIAAGLSLIGFALGWLLYPNPLCGK